MQQRMYSIPCVERLRVAGSKVRQNGADYLFYSLIDMIVDNYFVVMEKLGEKIEGLEEDIVAMPIPVALLK
jgi:magnesium transporter